MKIQIIGEQSEVCRIARMDGRDTSAMKKGVGEDEMQSVMRG